METIEAPRLRVGLPLLFQALAKSQPRRFTIIVPSVGKITASSVYHHCSKRWQNHSLVGLPSLFQALEKITASSVYHHCSKRWKNHSLVGLLFASVAQLACANSSVRTLRT